jgi:hypothetical protein
MKATLSSQNNLKKKIRIRSQIQPRVIVSPTVGPGPAYGFTMHSRMAAWAPPQHGPTGQNRWATTSAMWQHGPTTPWSH